MNVEQAKIIRIDEPDFGCEGRPDCMVVMDTVTVATLDNGTIYKVPVEQKSLWEHGLDEGMLVLIKIDRDGMVTLAE